MSEPAGQDRPRMSRTQLSTSTPQGEADEPRAADASDRQEAQREKNALASPRVQECLHCGGEFHPRRAGHVFCSNSCRHQGATTPHERASMVNLDPEAIQRLLDPSRDPNEQVRDDDWHPHPGSQFFDLDLVHTVAFRRRQLHSVTGKPRESFR